MAELGADGRDPRIGRACEFVLQASQDQESHGFAVTLRKTLGSGNHAEVIRCLTGNMVWALIRLGFLDDPRVRKGLDWICRYQRADDGAAVAPTGWPYDRYEMCWGRHSCHMGVVKALKALAAVPIGQLTNYLLDLHIFKKSHDLYQVARPGWLRFGFPLMYQTDVLEILGILVDLGCRDPRMAEALDIVRQKQTGTRRWKLENTFNGKMIKDVEEKGQESKWITLRALKVLMTWDEPRARPGV